MKNKKLKLLFKCSLVYAFAVLQVGIVYASGGRCVDDGTHPGQNWQTLCDAGATQMHQFPGQEARICEGYPGCAYIP